MTNRMLGAYVVTVQRMRERADRMATRDAGQASLEYAAVIAIIAVVVGVVSTAFTGAQETVTTGVKNVIQKVLK